jgi:hypothetical protein
MQEEMQLTRSERLHPDRAVDSGGLIRRKPKSASGFDAFIAEFRRGHLAGLSRNQFAIVAEERADRLSKIASNKGYRAALTSAHQPYRGMIGYVTALYDIQSTRHHSD